MCELVHRFKEEVLNSSELWKTGELRKAPSDISGITHGEYFRKSLLSAPAVPGEEDDLRVGLLLGYDDLEIANPLGVARGKHKLACFYLAIANLAAPKRFEHENMCLLTLVLEKVLKRCGAVRVVAGADAITGELLEADFGAFGCQIRQCLARNVCLTVCRSTAIPMHATATSRPLEP